MALKIGTNSAETLIGTADADTIKGYGGNDVLKGMGGADTLNGGAGIDTAFYYDSTESVFVSLDSGIGAGGSAQGDTLSGIENVWGSIHGDRLFGNEVNNELVGADGDDTLSGGGGADVLDGGAGRDLIFGGSDADILNGGPGFDTASYDGSPVAVNVSLAIGFGYGGDAHGDSLIGIEAVDGSGHDDVLHGDAATNLLYGYYGADTLFGGGGDDTLWGDFDNDQLYGQDGNDELAGHWGDDTLDGGSGRDTLRGDDQADTFVWTSTDHTGTAISTSDLVLDFNRAEGDRLHLGGIDADVYAAGNQDFSFIGAAPFSGTPGEINYVHVNGETIVQMQTGTSTDVEGVIRIYGIVTPEASWFVL